MSLGRLLAQEIPPPASSPTPQRVHAVMELLVSLSTPQGTGGGYPISQPEQTSKGNASSVAVPLSRRVPQPCPPASPRSPRGTEGRSHWSQGRIQGDAGVMPGAAGCGGRAPLQPCRAPNSTSLQDAVAPRRAGCCQRGRLWLPPRRSREVPKAIHHWEKKIKPSARQVHHIPKITGLSFPRHKGAVARQDVNCTVQQCGRIAQLLSNLVQFNHQ